MSSARTEGMTSPSATRNPAVTTSRVGRSAQLEDLRQQNYSAIMRAVMQSGPTARTDLAAAIGMSTGTVTKLTAALARAGLMTEAAEPPTGGIGRPKVPVAIDESRFGVIGVYFGYHRIIVCLLSLSGRLIDEIQEPQTTTDFSTLVARASDLIEQISATQRLEILGIGASTGGWVDGERGVVLDQPVLGWREARLADALHTATQRRVSVDSHFRALAMAEHWFGAATGVDDLIHLFVGNVVGAGFIFDGRPYRGARSAAGGLDHLPVASASGPMCECGQSNCFRVVASDLELSRRAKDAGLIADDAEVHSLIELAKGGDPLAQSLLIERARWVGAATATLIQTLDPQLVIVGGGVSSPLAYLEYVRAEVEKRLDRRLFPNAPSIVRASAFGPHAAAVAAGAVFMDEFYRSPESFVPELAPRGVTVRA